MSESPAMPGRGADAIVKREAGLADYLSLARLDHVTKHIFIVPGVVIAYLLRGDHNHDPIRSIILGMVSAFCIASANYVINEWLDREFDRHHPSKSARAAVQSDLSRPVVIALWIGLLSTGILCAWLASYLMFAVASVFALQGVVYNVRPLRTKDKAYLDVISESINNPLRLMIGWAMIDSTTLPPISIILTYWSGGAFLMAAKRLSEYLEITKTKGKDLLVRYRASFAEYDEKKLHVSCFTYGLVSVFFLAVFLMKYRIEYLLIIPFVVTLFSQYLVLAMETGSSAQNPEKLYQERSLLLSLVGLILVFIATSFVHMLWLGMLLDEHFIRLQ